MSSAHSVIEEAVDFVDRDRLVELSIGLTSIKGQFCHSALSYLEFFFG